PKLCPAANALSPEAPVGALMPASSDSTRSREVSDLIAALTCLIAGQPRQRVDQRAGPASHAEIFVNGCWRCQPVKLTLGSTSRPLSRVATWPALSSGHHGDG